MTTPYSKHGSQKLGSDGDPIRQGLFACQKMNELMQQVKLDGGESPFQSIADAAKLSNEGKKEEARSRLRSILDSAKLETRLQLWVWSALRELNEHPDMKFGSEILGVVIEVPMQAAYDTLAAYQDGSARYLNYSGRAIFWDAPDATIKQLCLALLAASATAGSRAKPRIDVALPKSGMQVTLLTRSGNYVVCDPPGPVVQAAQGLMIELIRRAKGAQS
jgi:hypothetical protein